MFLLLLFNGLIITAGLKLKLQRKFVIFYPQNRDKEKASVVL